MDQGISVYINNQLHELPENARISDLLEAVQIASRSGIALAINNQVIPRAEWETYTLAPNDQVTLIRATQGG